MPFTVLSVLLSLALLALDQWVKHYISLTLPLGEVRCLPVPEGAVPLPKPEHPALEVFVHRGKTITKVTASLFFGSGWVSRPTQCKTALLTDPEETKIRLAKLSDTAMKRAAEDMRQRSYHR